MKRYSDIPRLIAKKILGDPFSPTEEERFSLWLAKDDNHRLFDEIASLKMAAHILKQEREGYGEHMVARFRRSQKRMEHKRFRKLIPWISSVAAALLLLFVIPQFLYNDITTDLQSTMMQETMIVPGGTKATLTLTDGRAIAINESNKEDMDRLLDSVRTTACSVPQNEIVSQIAYTKLAVPKGGDFVFHLSDGTKVWLNSDSELSFPEKFEGNERRVYLEGEAFFDVTYNKQKAFVVSTARGNVRVYGTRFNLTNYPEYDLSTVLVEGKVGFCPTEGEKDVLIKPSQRLTYNADRKQVMVEEVDVTQYIAWIDKYFIFNGQTLEEIMSALSRWYNFNFSFQDDSLRNIRFSGRLYRYDDIAVLLDSYEQTAGIEFKINGNNIIITK